MTISWRWVEGELRQHRPSEKTRNAILIALAADGAGKGGLTGAGAGILKAALAVLAVSAKQIIPVVALVLLGLVGILWLHQRGPGGSSPIIPAVKKVESRPGSQQTTTTTALASATSGRQQPFPAARHSIRGSVIGQGSNRPIGGMIISVQGGGGRQEASTDAAGDFIFRDLPDDTYSLSVDVGDPALRDTLYIPADHHRIRVRLSGRDADGLIFKIARASYISGQVVDRKDEKPIAGAQIRLSHFRRTILMPTCLSDERGHFKLSGLFPDLNYTIQCSAPGYLPVTEDRLTIPSDKPRTDLVIRLTKGNGATISGRVVNRKKQPVDSASVELSTDPMRSAYAVTDAKGGFTFSNVQPGQARLGMESYDNIDVRLSVRPGQVIEHLELVVDQEILPGHVSGVLLDQNLRPITTGSIHVQIGAQAADNDAAKTQPDQQGRFKCANLPKDKKVNILYRGPSGPRQPTSAKNITVPTDGLTVIYESKTEGPGITLRGRIFDEATREAIPAFKVGVGSHKSYPPDALSTTYDPDGRFEMQGVQYVKGRTYLYAEAEGYASCFVPVELNEGATEGWVEVGLGSGASIEGNVVDDRGQTLEGARVFLKESEDRYVFSDAGGRFRLEYLGASSYAIVRASYPGYALYSGSPLKLEATTRNRNYRIRMGRGGAVAGTVYDSQSKPVQDVRINIQDDNIETCFYPRTDSEGIFLADLVPAGPYKVSVSGMNYESQKITVEEGKTSTVYFGLEGASVEGMVLAQGQPVPTASVALEDSPGVLLGAYTQQVVADQVGHYRLFGIPAGRYFLKVKEGRKALVTFPIQVRENDRLQQDLELHVGSIDGYVLKISNGAPRNKAYALLFERALLTQIPDGRKDYLSAMSYEYAATDDSGHFHFGRIAPGDYTIQIYGAGRDGGMNTPLAYTDVKLRPDQALDNVKITVQDGGSLRLHGVDARTGRELSLTGYLIVTLADEHGNLSGGSSSGSNPFLMEGLTAGEYRLGGTFRDNQDHTYICPLQVPVTVETGKTAEVNLPSVVAVRLEIIVQDIRQRPLTGFIARLYGPGEALVTLNNIDGNRISANVPAGPVHLLLYKTERKIFDGVIDVQPVSGYSADQKVLMVDTGSSGSK